jgi:peptide chain release factor 3
VPIFTFMNKCDRPTRDPLDLLDELENVLGIQAFPVIWPLGNGPDFRGVFDAAQGSPLFERVPGGKYQAPVNVTSLEDDAVRGRLDDYTYDQVTRELAMLDGAGHPFDLAPCRPAGRRPSTSAAP